MSEDSSQKPCYISCIMYVECKHGNVIASLRKDNSEDDGEAKWRLTFRSRVYVDNKTHDSEDKKHVVAYNAPGGLDEEQTRSSIAEAMLIFAGMMGGPVGEIDTVDLRCMEDDSKLLFELGSRPWAHVKVPTAAEVEKMKREGVDRGIC